MNWFKRFDYRIFLATLKFSKISFTNRLMRFISASGNGGVIWLLLAFVLLLINAHTRKVGWLLLGTLLLTTLVGEGILKRIFRRPRPFITHGPINLAIPLPNGFSFPSGHTASSFAAATICWQMGYQLGFLALFYAILMGISRIYLKAHYITDVIIGAVLGFLCACSSIWLFNRFLY